MDVRRTALAGFAFVAIMQCGIRNDRSSETTETLEQASERLPLQDYRDGTFLPQASVEAAVRQAKTLGIPVRSFRLHDFVRALAAFDPSVLTIAESTPALDRFNAQQLFAKGIRYPAHYDGVGFPLEQAIAYHAEQVAHERDATILEQQIAVEYFQQPDGKTLVLFKKRHMPPSPQSTRLGKNHERLWRLRIGLTLAATASMGDALVSQSFLLLAGALMMGERQALRHLNRILPQLSDAPVGGLVVEPNEVGHQLRNFTSNSHGLWADKRRRAQALRDFFTLDLHEWMQQRFADRKMVREAIGYAHATPMRLADYLSVWTYIQRPTKHTESLHAFIEDQIKQGKYQRLSGIRSAFSVDGAFLPDYSQDEKEQVVGVERARVLWAVHVSQELPQLYRLPKFRRLLKR